MKSLCNVLDFNILHGLTQDPILKSEDFLKPDQRSEHLSLEWLQARVSNIKIIPDVPDPIRQEFQRAKDLFIFGYFKYEFFTISSHYALLAHETAMKQKYVQSLGGKAVITYGNEIHEILEPTYFQLSNFIYEMKKNKHWKLEEVKVNNEKFPRNVNQVINWLVVNKKIKKWKGKMDDIIKNVRNSLSHPEHVQIFFPSMAEGILQKIAYDINELFTSK